MAITQATNTPITAPIMAIDLVTVIASLVEDVTT